MPKGCGFFQNMGCVRYFGGRQENTHGVRLHFYYLGENKDHTEEYRVQVPIQSVSPDPLRIEYWKGRYVFILFWGRFGKVGLVKLSKEKRSHYHFWWRVYKLLFLIKMQKNEIVLDGVEYVRKDSIPEVQEDWNTGDWNTGNLNTGNLNTGDLNTGSRNTGNRNTWDCNTGYSNTGSRNTGNRNTGDWNTGSWNTGNLNTGYLNTTEPKVRLFNKDCDIARDDLKFPDYFYFDITEWIPENAMTDEEKKEHDTYKTTDGYLRSYKYQEAFRKSWENTTDEDRRKTLSLPNWDNKLFFKISGINVEKELEVKTKEYSMNEVAKALGVDVAELKIKKD